MYPERATVLLPPRESGVDLVAGKAIVVSIKVDSKTIGRTLPIEVRSININPPHDPGVTCGHNKIVR
jgi:hypothetical protein